jgi:hypothetical protein
VLPIADQLPARNALFRFAVLAQAGKAWVTTTATASVTAPAPATVTATHAYTASHLLAGSGKFIM